MSRGLEREDALDVAGHRYDRDDTAAEPLGSHVLTDLDPVRGGESSTRSPAVIVSKRPREPRGMSPRQTERTSPRRIVRTQRLAEPGVIAAVGSNRDSDDDAKARHGVSHRRTTRSETSHLHVRWAASKIGKLAFAIAPTAMWGWSEEIGNSIQLRQRVTAVEGDLSQFTIPFEGATGRQLSQAEARLGRTLDANHRDLLTRANGWEQFFNFMHLLSCEALGHTGAGTLSGDADIILDTFFEGGSPVPDLPRRGDLLVIAANPVETSDLLLLWQVGPIRAGGRPVSWIAEGEEVERFDNVWQLLVSVDVYLQQDGKPV